MAAELSLKTDGESSAHDFLPQGSKLCCLPLEDNDFTTPVESTTRSSTELLKAIQISGSVR
jgi:hypothetical protein